MKNMTPEMTKLMQEMRAKMKEMLALMERMSAMAGMGDEAPSGNSALSQVFKASDKPKGGAGMAMVLLIGLLFSVCGTSFAYTEVNTSKTQGFASAVSVSTMPAVFTTTTTLMNVEEIRIWNYSTDVMYINFTVQATSTTAAATGIKIFQSTENNEFISLEIDKTATIYFTLAGDSGTGSLRVLQLGEKYKSWF